MVVHQVKRVSEEMELDYDKAQPMEGPLWAIQRSEIKVEKKVTFSQLNLIWPRADHIKMYFDYLN